MWTAADLGCEHRLELILRLNTFDDRKLKIKPARVDPLTVRTCVSESPQNATKKSSSAVPRPHKKHCPDFFAWMVYLYFPTRLHSLQDLDSY